MSGPGVHSTVRRSRAKNEGQYHVEDIGKILLEVQGSLQSVRENIAAKREVACTSVARCHSLTLLPALRVPCSVESLFRNLWAWSKCSAGRSKTSRARCDMRWRFRRAQRGVAPVGRTRAALRDGRTREPCCENTVACAASRGFEALPATAVETPPSNYVTGQVRNMSDGACVGWLGVLPLRPERERPSYSETMRQDMHHRVRDSCAR